MSSKTITQMTYGPRTLVDRVMQVCDENENTAEPLGDSDTSIEMYSSIGVPK